MLDAALKFEKAFVRLEEDDETEFLAWFGEDEPELEGEVIVSSKGKKRIGPPRNEDWSNALTFVNFLKVFYEMTLKMSVSLHPASHTTFHDLLAIEGEINDLFLQEDMVLSQTTTQMVLNDMANSMKLKFEKYWGDLDKVNAFLLIALVLDPRYKLGNLQHVLKMHYSDSVAALKKKNEVKDLLMQLYEEYVTSSTQNSSSSATSGITNVTSSSSVSSSSQHRGGRKRKEMEESWIKESEGSDTVILEHEIDRYITDPIEKVVSDFDILKWWKLNGVKYPGLALIAKDILAIPVSTVASESSFSTGGRVVNSFRASLTPKMVESLICMQNWLRADDISSLENEPTIAEMEFYEAMESEMFNTATSNKTAPATFQC